jgi:hypothetical protein
MIVLKRIFFFLFLVSISFWTFGCGTTPAPPISFDEAIKQMNAGYAKYGVINLHDLENKKLWPYIVDNIRRRQCSGYDGPLLGNPDPVLFLSGVGKEKFVVSFQKTTHVAGNGDIVKCWG